MYQFYDYHKAVLQLPYGITIMAEHMIKKKQLRSNKSLSDKFENDKRTDESCVSNEVTKQNVKSIVKRRR